VQAVTQKVVDWLDDGGIFSLSFSREKWSTGLMFSALDSEQVFIFRSGVKSINLFFGCHFVLPPRSTTSPKHSSLYQLDYQFNDVLDDHNFCHVDRLLPIATSRLLPIAAVSRPLPRPTA